MSEWEYNYQNNVYVLKGNHWADDKKHYRVDPDTGLRAYNHTTSMFHYGITRKPIDGRETPEEKAKKIEHNKEVPQFFKRLVDSPKQDESYFNSEEDYQTYLYHWINYNVPLSKLYWLSRSDRQLELAVSKMLENCGYEPEITGQRDDKGIDLQLLIKEPKPGPNWGKVCWIAIQCKGLSSPLGPSGIREIIGVREIGNYPIKYETGHVAVICPLGFTMSAKKLAFNHNVELIDANVLVEICHGNVDPFSRIRVWLKIPPRGKPIDFNMLE